MNQSPLQLPILVIDVQIIDLADTLTIPIDHGHAAHLVDPPRLRHLISSYRVTVPPLGYPTFTTRHAER
jgi:predicted GNAT superfamily acetyltransferase